MARASEGRMLRSLVAFFFATVSLVGCAADASLGDGDDAVPSEEQDLTVRPFDRCEPRGPCPDLRLNADVLASSIIIETRDVDPRSCSVAEGTIKSGGRRRLLR